MCLKIITLTLHRGDRTCVSQNGNSLQDCWINLILQKKGTGFFFSITFVSDVSHCWIIWFHWYVVKESACCLIGYRISIIGIKLLIFFVINQNLCYHKLLSYSPTGKRYPQICPAPSVWLCCSVGSAWEAWVEIPFESQVFI